MKSEHDHSEIVNVWKELVIHKKKREIQQYFGGKSQEIWVWFPESCGRYIKKL